MIKNKMWLLKNVAWESRLEDCVWRLLRMTNSNGKELSGAKLTSNINSLKKLIREKQFKIPKAMLIKIRTKCRDKILEILGDYEPQKAVAPSEPMIRVNFILGFLAQMGIQPDEDFESKISVSLKKNYKDYVRYVEHQYHCYLHKHMNIFSSISKNDLSIVLKGLEKAESIYDVSTKKLSDKISRTITPITPSR